MADVTTLATIVYFVAIVLPLYPIYKIARLIWWPPFILAAFGCDLSFIGAGMVSFFGGPNITLLLLMLGFILYSLTFFLLLRVLRRGLKV